MFKKATWVIGITLILAVGVVVAMQLQKDDEVVVDEYYDTFPGKVEVLLYADGEINISLNTTLAITENTSPLKIIFEGKELYCGLDMLFVKALLEERKVTAIYSYDQVTHENKSLNNLVTGTFYIHPNIVTD